MTSPARPEAQAANPRFAELPHDEISRRSRVAIDSILAVLRAKPKYRAVAVVGYEDGHFTIRIPSEHGRGVLGYQRFGDGSETVQYELNRIMGDAVEREIVSVSSGAESGASVDRGYAGGPGKYDYPPLKNNIPAYERVDRLINEL